MRRAAGLFTTLTLLAGSSATCQEAVLLRIRGQVGVPQHFISILAIYESHDTSQTDTSWNLRLRSVMYFTRTLTAVSGDTLTFRDVSDSIGAGSPSLGEVPLPAPGRLRHTILTTVMSDRGRIIQRYVRDSATGQLGKDSLGRVLGGGSIGVAFGILPERPVQVGDSWSDTGSGVVATSVASYRLDRVEMQDSSRIAVIEAQQRLDSTGIRTAEVWLDLTTGQFVGSRETVVRRRTSERGPAWGKVDNLTWWLLRRYR